MDCSLTGSSVHGIFQTRILEWFAIFASRGSSRPRDRAHLFCVSCIGRQILYHWATISYHHFSALQLRVQLTLSIHSYLLFSDPRTVAHTLNSIQPYLFSLGQITTAFFFLLLQSMSFISLQSGNTSLIPSPFPLHLFEVCFQKNRS